jgi:hypothetical protein
MTCSLWGKKKDKAIHVTGRGGLQVCETPKLPHYFEARLRDGGEIVNPTRQPTVRSLHPEKFLVLIFC